MTPEEQAAFHRGQLAGLRTATDCIGGYIKEFSPGEETEKHLGYIRSGICNAINLLSLRQL